MGVGWGGGVLKEIVFLTVGMSADTLKKESDDSSHRIPLIICRKNYGCIVV